MFLFIGFSARRGRRPLRLWRTPTYYKGANDAGEPYASKNRSGPSLPNNAQSDHTSDEHHRDEETVVLAPLALFNKRTCDRCLNAHSLLFHIMAMSCLFLERFNDDRSEPRMDTLIVLQQRRRRKRALYRLGNDLLTNGRFWLHSFHSAIMRCTAMRGPFSARHVCRLHPWLYRSLVLLHARQNAEPQGLSV